MSTDSELREAAERTIAGISRARAAAAEFGLKLSESFDDQELIARHILAQRADDEELDLLVTEEWVDSLPGAEYLDEGAWRSRLAMTSGAQLIGWKPTDRFINVMPAANDAQPRSARKTIGISGGRQ